MAKLCDFPEPIWAPEVAEPDWLCAPCGMTNISDPLTRANFDALADELDDRDPNGADWEILRFGHFTADWLENIFIRPYSALAEYIASVKTQMATYPCLSEELWIQYDEQEAKEAQCTSK